MPIEDTDTKVVTEDAESRPTRHSNDTAKPDETVAKKEIGGRDGPDPTRYGDWEKAGRCIDF